MRVRTAGAFGVVAAGVGALVSATPAVAAPDCGRVPAGATLTVLGGTTCQLDFAVAGSYSWTTPAGMQGLQALVLAGGSGAIWDGPGSGYAGSAGELVYVDYTTTAAGSPATVVVGDGGTTGDTPTDGQDSSITMSGVTTFADGGLAFGATVCWPEGITFVDAGNGYGAGGSVGGTSDCEDSYAPGLTPSVDTVDSNSAPRPAVFADITTTFGLGGRVLVTADTLPADASLDGLGEGAHVRFDSASGNGGAVVEANATGGSGHVILRYTAAAALAQTGVEVAPAITVAALTAGLGAALLAFSRRRKRA